MSTIDLAPDTTLVASFVERSGVTLKAALAELFDNAFDKDATRITVTSSDDSLIIEDNGRGIADWKSLLKLGRHQGRSGAIGRWGVGFKHATAWIAEVVDIETRNRNASAFTRLDWTELAKRPDWKWEVGDHKPDPGPSFTRLTLSSIRKRRLRTLSQIIPELAERYSPGLKAGMQIIIDGKKLRPVPLPKFDGEPLITTGSYEGCEYRLTAGLKPDRDQPARCGLDVAYLHRLIMQKDFSACGPYSGQRFYGYLELLHSGEADWTLSDHKDDFDEREAFSEELFLIIEPILKQAAAAKDTLEFRDCGRIIAERFHFSTTKGKEKRHPGDDDGTVEPKGTKRKRRSAAEIDPDPLKKVTSRLHSCGVTITFDCPDPTRVGVVQTSGKQIVVCLNPTYPVVAEKDPDAITVLVCGLLALDDEWALRTRQMFLPGCEKGDGATRIKDLSDLLLRVLPSKEQEEKPDAA